MKKLIAYFLLSSYALFACQSSEKSGVDSNDELAVESMSRVSIAEIEEGIKQFIADQKEEHGGFFHVKDENHDLKMKLVRVHTEYLSNLGPDSHFACVDLVDEHGDVYDVDFFMEGKPGDMKVRSNSVHKLNGRPFYSWKQNSQDKTWYKVPLKDAGNNLLGVIEGQDSFVFHYTATIPKLSGTAFMWVPLAESDEYQDIKVESIQIPGKHERITDPIFDNRLLFLELGPEDSEKQLEISYSVTRREKGPYPAPFPDSAIHLASNILMPTGGRFEEIARQALGDKIHDSPLVQARALYDYIIDNMRYMKFGNFGKGDSNYACDSKTGNCTEFHSYFISLARSVGIPAKFSIGASIPSDRNEGGIDGYHCWAEFYADGKWWPVDISEANKYTALATYYFGRHPANRVELSRGRDLQVSPGPSSGPINFIAYPYLEIDGKEVKLATRFSFTRRSNG
ncbi:Transglutaminase-like enzyme, putative cysteine protease [Lunatimonas lonarensis]|uniref:Transglutaminase-like enzyme, putative cysteine protease n=1 Tax=Lunatimonas lonarensis TaxID=1232681 RepID=R7ZSM9_9BACT|nr:transglutaminase-like domain-containing protein [Lunatimonas lonarensis]EON77115.1 Transglutaminase-like enzyme, putative cysteine protease [Lunatimonas lonarensis]